MNDSSEDISSCPFVIAEKRLRQFEEAWNPFGVEALIPESEKIKNPVHDFEEDDFHIGKLLGRGTFSTAHRVFLKEDIAHEKGCLSDSDHAFAMKQLQRGVADDLTVMKIAAADLAIETSILTKLNHENVIKLHGVKSGNMMESLQEGRFFVVLDLLFETLDVRMERLRKEHKRRNLFHASSRKIISGNINHIAMGIVRGMNYLHSRNIVFRDLKPTNIGFDEFDRVKIFDFGLARECTQSSHYKGKPRLMTGGTGTPRYMAPEVSRMDQSYGFPADVYSFSILLWEIVTSRQAFFKYSPSQISEKVVHGTKRPNLKYIDSLSLRTLLESAWSYDPTQRPSFEFIFQSLENIAVLYDHDMIDKRRRKQEFERSRSEPLSGRLLDRSTTSWNHSTSSILDDHDSVGQTSESAKKGLFFSWRSYSNSTLSDNGRRVRKPLSRPRANSDVADVASREADSLS